MLLLFILCAEVVGRFAATDANAAVGPLRVVFMSFLKKASAKAKAKVSMSDATFYSGVDAAYASYHAFSVEENTGSKIAQRRLLNRLHAGETRIAWLFIVVRLTC